MSSSTKCNFFSILYRLGLSGILLICLAVYFLIISSALDINGITGSFKVPHFLDFYFSVFVFTYFILWLISLLSVDADISIRRHIFLYQSLTTISDLLFFIFQSVWIENSLRIAAFLASVIVLLDVYTICHNPIFHYFTPVGFQLKSEQLKVSLDFRDSFIYLPTPPLGQDMTQGQFLSGVS